MERENRNGLLPAEASGIFFGFIPYDIYDDELLLAFAARALTSIINGEELGVHILLASLENARLCMLESSYLRLLRTIIQCHLTSHLNDPGIHEALNLLPNFWVLHVLLERGWITLCLLEDTLHDWILHDTKDLRIIIS